MHVFASVIISAYAYVYLLPLTIIAISHNIGIPIIVITMTTIYNVNSPLIYNYYRHYYTTHHYYDCYITIMTINARYHYLCQLNKNAVSALYFSCKILSFTLKDSLRN